ncbi:hypothetical protein C2845_PM01G41130 [Panicum miliaceum]|uniref:At2g35280-like TPR domain-containing protein n=1 Tax=Panicum miliaceum TaxID=4540 RepID=A0A3L6TTC7_PANMI|nr:hypothetical protein C2845_PM01G41130 [Panicum miliaceum]
MSLIEIASRVAAQSEDAIVDLGNLHTTCKAMCAVCGATEVGQRLALRRVLRRRFYLGLEYRATLITRLAAVGNPEACFCSGMCLVFGEQRDAIMPFLDPLRCAAEAGHKEAIYVLALLLYRPNSGAGDDDEAQWLLHMVEGPKAGVAALPWKNKTCTKRCGRIIPSLWDPTPVVGVEIAARLAESPDSALVEVGSLRVTCKKMRLLCRMPEVGRRLAVHPLLPIGSWDLYYDNRFRQSLIMNLFRVGNLVACFFAGMRVVLVEARSDLQPSLDMLECAAKAGHEVAMYVLAMYKYRPNSGADDDASAMELLRKIEGDDAGAGAPVTWTNTACARLRQQALLVSVNVVPLTPRRVPAPKSVSRIHSDHRCASRPMCGSVAAWEGRELFCSEECRIRSESAAYFTSVWP